MWCSTRRAETGHVPSTRCCCCNCPSNYERTRRLRTALFLRVQVRELFLLSRFLHYPFPQQRNESATFPRLGSENDHRLLPVWWSSTSTWAVHMYLDLQTSGLRNFTTMNNANLYLFFNLRTSFSPQRRTKFRPRAYS
jgi:hypothetical protein